MKRKLLSLLFAGAAYGIYKYTKMTPEEKQDIKKKGKDFLMSLAGLGSQTAETKVAPASTENNY